MAFYSQRADFLASKLWIFLSLCSLLILGFHSENHNRGLFVRRGFSKGGGGGGLLYGSCPDTR